MNRPACFFTRLGWSGACEYREDGQPDRCHLIPAQRLRREGFTDEVWNPHVWVPGCRKHHGIFDNLHANILPLAQYPRGLQVWAEQHGFFYALGRGWLHAAELEPESPEIARAGEW